MFQKVKSRNVVLLGAMHIFICMGLLDIYMSMREWGATRTDFEKRIFATVVIGIALYGVLNTSGLDSLTFFAPALFAIPVTATYSQEKFELIISVDFDIVTRLPAFTTSFVSAISPIPTSPPRPTGRTAFVLVGRKQNQAV
jgi:hypothetical protein